MAHNNDKTNLENYDVNNAAFIFSEHILTTLLTRGLLDRQEYTTIHYRISKHYNID